MPIDLFTPVDLLGWLLDTLQAHRQLSAAARTCMPEAAVAVYNKLCNYFHTFYG